MGNRIEIIRRGRVAKFLADTSKDLPIGLKARSIELWVLFKDNPVVFPVEPKRRSDEIFPHAILLAEILDLRWLNDFVFEETREHDTVERALSGFRKKFASQFGILLLER